MSGTDLLDGMKGGAVAADACSDDHQVVVEPAAPCRAIPRSRQSFYAPPGGHHLRRGAEPEGLAPEAAEPETSGLPDRVGPGGGGAAGDSRRRGRGEGHGRGVHGRIGSSGSAEVGAGASVRGGGDEAYKRSEVTEAEAARMGECVGFGDGRRIPSRGGKG